MHGECVPIDREYEIQGRENSFFNFTSITSASNQRDLAFEVQYGEIMLSCLVHFRISHKPRGVYNCPFRLEIIEFLRFRSDEHIENEKVGPGILIDCANRHPVLGFRACKTIANIELLIIEISHHFIVEPVEGLRAERDVYLPPPDLIFSDLILNDETVHRGSARKFSGIDSQCP